MLISVSLRTQFNRVAEVLTCNSRDRHAALLTAIVVVAVAGIAGIIRMASTRRTLVDCSSSRYVSFLRQYIGAVKHRSVNSKSNGWRRADVHKLVNLTDVWKRGIFDGDNQSMIPKFQITVPIK